MALILLEFPYLTFHVNEIPRQYRKRKLIETVHAYTNIFTIYVISTIIDR
jgi:hypothetical protein